MQPSHIGVVTGANKGIGLAIVRQLALQYPTSALCRSSSTQRLLLYLTARDEIRGEQALKSLYEEDALLKRARALKGGGSMTEIRFHQLDIRDTMSIRGFKDFLGREHANGIDFVVNNAGA